MLNEGNDKNNSYDHLEWLFCHFLPFLKDSKIDLLDSASAVKKKLNKVSFNSTCSLIYFFTWEWNVAFSPCTKRDWGYLRGREKRILSVLKIRSINLKKIEADYWKWRRFYCVSQLFRITRDLRCQKRLWHGFWVFLRCQSKFEG